MPKYPLRVVTDATVFRFTSEGPRGAIEKVVVFQELDDDVYNLAFGDAIGAGDEFSDKINSDNADAEKVLATVVDALFQFLEVQPEATVYITGSTQSCTRLYRMGF